MGRLFVVDRGPLDRRRIIPYRVDAYIAPTLWMNRVMETQLVVVGGGPGGYAAAFLAADMGMQVTLVEAEPRLGGTCLLKGCIPSKALLHVARVISETREMGEWGVAFKPPSIDIGAMRARKEKVIGALSSGLKQLAKKNMRK